MRQARKLFLLTVMAVVAVAFSASSASAQTVELSQEPGTHCGAVTIVNHVPQGGCDVRAVSTEASILVRHTGVSEVEFSECDNVFEARFNEAGHGYIYNQQLTPAGPPCGREPCDESGLAANNPHDDLPWAAQITEPVNGNGAENLRVSFCLLAFSTVAADEGLTGTTCTVDLAVTQVNHEMVIETPRFDPDHENGAPCINLGGAVELQGRWVTAPDVAHPNLIEVVHTP